MRKIRLHITLMALGLALVAIGRPAVAANYLEGIGVSRSGDSIVVSISTSAACQYNAFLTESKPERIVIDMSGVVNNLPEKQFLDLPLRSINSIRTSQFKSDPEPQARVVLDIKRPIDFRYSQNGNTITIKLPAISDEIAFTRWESSADGEIMNPAVAADEVMKPAVETPDETPVREVAAPDTPESNEPIEPVELAVSSAPAATPGVPVDTTPKRQLVEYTASSLKDPFVPLIGAGKIVEGLPSLENLKLVGILENSEMNRALLEDGEGNGYILKPNDRVQSGYLVTVTESKAIFQVTEYGWTRTVAMELEIPEIR